VYGKAQALLEFCDSKGIHIESYGPLSSIVRAPGGPVDPVVKKIAQELGATDGQVLLKWAHQITNGGLVTEIKDLSDEQVKAIGEAGKERPQRIFVSSIIT
jgi:diketogulonate reductase-like aldo/keto reductase